MTEEVFVFSLSYAQQRLWFLDQLEPGNAAYNIFDTVAFNQELNVAALEESLNEIVRRHEALRTSFMAVDGQPMQVIAPSLRLALPILDLSQLSRSECRAEIERRSEEEAQRPFDLTRGPLLRTMLLRLSESEHLLLLTMHHIISDGWSMGVFTHELWSLYEAYSAGEPSPLAELPIQYADFAAWQRQWLTGEVLESQLKYWREQLEGAPAVLELPTDMVRPSVQSFRGASQGWTLSEELTNALKQLSQQEGVTLFMTLLAAFQLLLSRYTNQDDVVVGSPIANRTRAEIEPLIGFFVNTLVLRTDLSGNPSFRELLARVREVTLGAYAHQDLPFEKLVEELQPERNLSRNPLFQVMFQLFNVPRKEKLIVHAKSKKRLIESITTQVDLLLYVEETKRGLQMTLEYSTDLFEDETIRRMIGHFQTLLEAIAADPGQRLLELPLLREVERRQLLVQWDSKQEARPHHECIHQLFEQQAAQTPEAIAVSYEEHQLTYRELNGRANKLGHYLRRRGARPEVLVGICLQRSVEMVVGLLGILKAGAAYVPLDPACPEQRLDFMLRDSGARVLVTEEQMKGRWSEHEVEVVSLDGDWEEIERESAENVESAVGAENLAYMIYTSGSTGTPKGVQLEHRGISNLVSWHNRFFNVSPVDRASLFSGLSFDASVGEIWPYLMVGASIHIVNEETRILPLKLRDWFLSKNISIGFLPTPVAESILSLEWPGNTTLRTLLTAGDILHRYPPSSLPFELVNNYGPTENTMVTTAGLVLPEGRAGTLPPIGTPIWNTEVYILDEELEPVPMGVSGHLHIAGLGLARGYLQRPDLTAEKFIPHPFSREAGGRLYRTGDRARYRGDGTIEFVGRIDHQVKVRGYRIELGEIESLLREHQMVEDVVVTVREDVPGDRRLVAYLVGSEKSAPSIGELYNSLKEKLPDYMIPSAFEVLDELPLTPSGKVDRQALPAPSATMSDFKDNFAAPRNPNEEVLAEIWAQTLGVTRIGIHDNFFELGGHSLLVTQILSAVRNIFHVELPIRHLFESPTVAQLSSAITEITNLLPEEKRTHLARQLQEKVSMSRFFPLSYAQQRLWFLDQLEPGNAAYNIFDTVAFNQELNVAALEESLNEIVRRHEALRTSFMAVDGQPMQVIAPSLRLALPILDLSQLSRSECRAEIERRSEEEAQRPFDLTRGPLLRTMLLRLSESEHLLLLTMHHIISDGWSMGVFTHELWSLYEAYSAGEPSPLAELPIQYADFAAWQRQWLTGEVLESQLKYWREQLEGAPAVLELPTDMVRPSVQSFRGASQGWTLSEELTNALKQLSQQEGVTLFMTLLAAFQLLLSRYTNQDDVVVGSPIANRTRAEIEPLIGFFVNTLVLRTDLSGNPSFRELLARVREVTLGAYAHQDLPFEKLVEELQPERNLSRNPLFQVMFQLFNVPLSDERDNSLDLEDPISEGDKKEVEVGTAKFDMGIDMWESDEGLAGQLEYSTDLFEDETIRRMIGHFQTLLEAIAADPGQRLLELPLLREVERQQLLVEWNSTQRPKTHHRCIHEVFETQVERTPEAVAVASNEGQLSYRELNKRANQLAHYLRRRGVGPETLVAICVERSVEMVVGLLGILKAGAAYVPLDPAYPEQRLGFMLGDTGAKVLITQERLRRGLPEHEAEVVSLDGEWKEIERESGENPESAVDGGNLAYVIYTSGSTGTPKGVMIQHSSLVNYIEMAKIEYQLRPEDRVLQFSSISFDAAAEEIYICLTLGATSVLRTDTMISSVPAFLQKCDDFKISVLDIPTSYWHELTRNLASQNLQLPESIRLVVTGGERALPERLSAWHKNVPGHVRLMQGYGPTEVTVVATIDDLSTPEKVGHNFREVPIGRPIGNTQAFILDKNLQPVPIGVPGELHVSGEGLARGYLNRPEATAEKFIPNPFSEEPGARLYRTGDKVRYLPDGRIEFLGRIDHQVKIRGFRIELGEIETALSKYPFVRDAVVATRQNGYDDKRLVAYLVADSAPGSFLNDVRNFLREQLPEYMIPSAYVLLESLPMTPSGKVNREALPEPDNNHHEIEATYVAPRTEVEQTITGVWREVFNVEKLSTHSNFFDLGGHSLSMVRVCSRLREVMNIEISMIDMFKYPTINSLAKFLSQKGVELPSHQQVDDRVGKQKEALARRKQMNWRVNAHA